MTDFNTAKKSRATHLGQLTKLYKELEKQMSSIDNVVEVKELFDRLCDKYEQFKTVHFQCLELCEDPEMSDTLEKNFESCKTNFVEFKERYAQWIPERMDADSIPGSATSSTSRLKNAKVKRLIAEQKLKTLRERQTFGREQLRLETMQKELNDKSQLLEQESIVMEARLEESVWAEEGTVILARDRLQDGLPESYDMNVGNTSTPARLDRGNASHDRDCRNDFGVTFDVDDIVSGRHGETRLKDVRNSASGLDVEKLALVLQEGFSLPKPELLTFSGSALEYCKFIKNFETNVECKVSDNRLRLSYLIQYCTGEAKSCIEDCVLLDSDVGYNRAKSILQSRYGRPHVIARSHIDKLLHGPQIKASDVDELSKLALDMQKCQITLSQLGFVSDIDNSENLRRIVRRLPLHLRSKWAEIAHSVFESGREPQFSDLTKFVDERSRVATSVYGIDIVKENIRAGKSSHGPTENVVKGKVTTLSTYTESQTQKYNRKCYCCSGTCTDLAACNKFKNMSLADRKKYVVKSKLCFNCLKRNHVFSKCRKEKLCTVSDCTSKHHPLLHNWVPVRSDNAVTQPSVNCAAVNGSFVKTCLGIVPVNVKGGNGQICQTYALLDDGADKTLCDERLIKKLGVSSRPVTFQISTVSSTGNTTHGQEVDLCVSPVSGNGGDVQLNNVWTVKILPISTCSAATAEDIRGIPYLYDIQIPNAKSNEVMLLIGTDNPEAHVPLEVRTGCSHEPYAVRTRLGWAVRGPVARANIEQNRTEHRKEAVNIHFGQSSDVILQQQLERLWNSDFNDVLQCEKESMSVEDKRALRVMESTLSHVDGHYEMGLPWRADDIKLPNNLALAHARLNQLKRKLSHDKILHEMYTKTVTDYIDKGYAKEVADKDTNCKRIWYLPHHPVTNVNKPGKVRVVFDCAAKYKDISLNSQLLQGPDMMNSLVGVLTRFRQEKIALGADIEAMFHQVRVCEADRDALRFLWWPGGDMSKSPKIYCMQVHLFGATSSPSCAAYALKRTASDNAGKFPDKVVDTVYRNFYVDDCLKSVATEEMASKLAADLQSLMKIGGFRLTKWISNSRAVLNTIPESERAPTVISLDPKDILPCDRALGVNWNVDDDEITFKIKVADKPLTRRGILSIVSAIFDPLGLVAPVTLRAKTIIQNLCRKKIGWDDVVPQKEHEDWRRWISNLPCLEKIHINRCFQPRYFSEVKNIQLHVFSDGSETGYGACAYLRITDQHDNITCSLVLGKSRLAPIKQSSIPRLELCGAVVSCRLYAMLKEELDLKIDHAVFWTDSMILLGYINNTTRRFKTFVGNRLSFIHELTIPEQWRYVDSGLNPADLASRGIDPCNVNSLKTWLDGPEYLLQDELTWPRLPNKPEVAEEDSEVKREVAVNTIALYTGTTLDDLINHYSDWNKLLKAFAWFQRFIVYCRRHKLTDGEEVKRGDLVAAEMQNATHAILRHVHRANFIQELEDLRKGNHVKMNSRLAMLNPILVNGLIRMSGRQVLTNYDTCPIILPYGDHVTELIIRYYHENNGHVGRQHVLAEIRAKYWILRGPSAVKKTIGRCIACRRQHNPPLTQQMAPLIQEQTTPDKPPFTYVGIDYFGPLMVKSGRSCVKRYGCLFSCLTTRAVHIEIAHSLTTDSFISAYQRFTSRRGHPEKLFSDNGTNLVSGDKELKKSLEEWNQSKIGRYLVQRNIDWHFNPPYASNMGGAWERMIRSTRTILKALAKEQLLTDERLLTLIAETERIINDRPITPVSNDPRDPPALTPNMLLLMKCNSSIPKGVFQKDDVYCKRWWKQIQYLADVFWKRWIREYLPSLQIRQKWQRKTRNLQVDDVVLVSDDDIPRGQWPLGRVTEVFKGRDGLVRKCLVRSRNSNILRPITKLCLLESTN